MLILNKNTLATTLLVAMSLAGSARAMVIDDFTLPTSGFDNSAKDVVPVDSSAVWTSDSGPLSGVLGGTRDLSAFLTDRGSSTNGNVQTYVSDGLFTSSRDGNSTDRGISSVDWDGIANGALDPMGLGGVDLTSDGSSMFDLMVASDNLLGGGFIDLTVWDMFGHKSTVQVTSSVTTTSIDYLLNFSAFTLVDFTKVGAIQLTVDDGVHGGRKIKIDSLTTKGTSTSVPEPATLSLLGLGIAGLGWGKRRRTV